MDPRGTHGARGTTTWVHVAFTARREIGAQRWRRPSVRRHHALDKERPLPPERAAPPRRCSPRETDRERACERTIGRCAFAFCRPSAARECRSRACPPPERHRAHGPRLRRRLRGRRLGVRAPVAAGRHPPPVDDAGADVGPPRGAGAVGARRVGPQALPPGPGERRRGDHEAAGRARHGHRRRADPRVLPVLPARQHRRAAAPLPRAAHAAPRRAPPPPGAHAATRRGLPRGGARRGAGRPGAAGAAAGVHRPPDGVVAAVGAADPAPGGRRARSRRVGRGGRGARRPALADRRDPPGQADRRRRGERHRLVPGAARAHHRPRADRRVRARGAGGRVRGPRGQPARRAGVVGRRRP